MENFLTGWSKVNSACPQEYFGVEFFVKRDHVNGELANERRTSLQTGRMISLS